MLKLQTNLRHQVFFVVDEEACTRCALCVDRCPTGVISLGKFAGSLADQAVQKMVFIQHLGMKTLVRGTTDTDIYMEGFRII